MAAEFPEPGSPQTILFAKVRERLNRVPFEPFKIVTTSGRSYNVPTADHAGVVPIMRSVHVADDHGGDVEIYALHIASIETIRKRRRPSRSVASKR